MSSVMESIDVHVPVHTAYNQWTQFEDFPQFMEGVEEIRQVNDTLTHWKVKVAGASREYDAQITEQRPDERIAWTSVEEPKNAGVVTFHRLDDDNTRVALQLEVEPEGFLENVADKTGMVKHRAKNDLKRFKEFIEERGSETGAWRGNVDRPDQ
ncbi:SRPBCC family protein [Actinoallomurus rhizosphaericola]|uniref:SRPBCC family protein n=1 Tax=Actinoallomurus rhizosphaericola TaxID=2952536 RepID=UPI00209263E3|nr:SRPBCC family protein [Actinoallomurus rhizosphaericola]MCO5999430.1 SRPBCC family protein [Actinoallomurus rhizosphaericola]